MSTEPRCRGMKRNIFCDDRNDTGSHFAESPYVALRTPMAVVGCCGPYETHRIRQGNRLPVESNRAFS
jgi:hypothetical protein